MEIQVFLMLPDRASLKDDFVVSGKGIKKALKGYYPRFLTLVVTKLGFV